ncbi:MAG: phasin family protein [Flavobacteriaceae bacterium]
MPKSQSEMSNKMDIFNPFAAVMPETMKQFGGMQSRLVSACMQYNLEYLEFLKRRVEKDIALIEEMSAKEEPSEVMSACTDFWRAAFEDYSDEIGKFAGMSSSLINEARSETTKQVQTLKDEVKVQAAA